MANDNTFHSCQFSLPPVAKSERDCEVGPTVEESAKNQSSWHSKSYQKSASSIYRKRNRDGSAVVAPDSFAHAVGTFLSSGCCVIKRNALPSNFVKQALEKATNDLNLLEDELQNLRRKAIQTQNSNLLAQVSRGDFRELIDRDGGRRDVRFQLDRFPFSAQGLIYNPVVFPLVKELLGGGDVCLLYAGVMWAKKTNDNDKCEPQHWHGDGGHLFDHAHLPPHCINVFYPLVNLSAENGPTEFVPGSHRLGCFHSPTERQFGLCCDAGGAILFDYRTKHRGGSNTTDTPRPVLYLAYCKPFFKDTGNIRSEQSLIHSKSISSPPWVSRMLPGQAVEMGKGFENTDQGDGNTAATSSSKAATTGSGERWVLFRMNVEIPDCDESKIITVYHGDVANEVSSQFVSEHGLDESFVPVLQGAIQQQMDAVAA